MKIEGGFKEAFREMLELCFKTRYESEPYEDRKRVLILVLEEYL